MVIKGIQKRNVFRKFTKKSALEIHKMPVGMHFSPVHGGKMAVKLETMKDREIQCVRVQHSAVGSGENGAWC